MQAQYLCSVDLVRGYASLIVCLFHMSAAGKAFPGTVLGTYLSWCGADGVLLFFVVSGFVIPLSLHTGGYTLAGFWRFMIKRITRIDPPYLVSMAVAVALWLRFQYSVTGHPLELSGLTPWLHIGYLIDAARAVGYNYHWYVSVYWTLAFEFQFYIAIALLYGVVTSRHRLVRLSFLAAMVAIHVAIASGLVPKLPVFVSVAGYFAFGILLFQIRTRIAGRTEGLIAGAVLLAVLLLESWRFTIHGPLLALLFLRLEISTPITNGLGRISYSLYLYHDSVGTWSRGAFVTVAGFNPQLAVLAGTAVSLVVSVVMYFAIERPSLMLSRRISYVRRANGQ